MARSHKATVAQLNQIYDLYRDTRLNRYYYGAMLARYTRLSLIFNIIVALGASGGAFASLEVWRTDVGHWVWAGIALVGAAFAVVRPFLNLDARIKRYADLHSRHLANYLDLRELVVTIARERQLTDEMVSRFEAAYRRYHEASRDDDPAANERLRKRYDAAVRQEVPKESLWIPAESDMARA